MYHMEEAVAQAIREAPYLAGFALACWISIQGWKRCEKRAAMFEQKLVELDKEHNCNASKRSE